MVVVVVVGTAEGFTPNFLPDDVPVGGGIFPFPELKTLGALVGALNAGEARTLFLSPAIFN